MNALLLSLLSRATGIADGPNRADVAGTDHRTSVVGNWSPWEARVEDESAIQLPAAKNLSCKIVAVAENRQIPQSVNADIVRGVVIRWAPFGPLINRKRLVGAETRAFRGNLIHRFAVGINHVGQETVLEAVFELHVQGIEVSVRVRRKGENIVDERILQLDRSTSGR